jgi:tetratricopeptide (TPR) repeat protein
MLERNAALWQAASKRPGFVLFVVVKPCKLPTLSDHIRRCELYGAPEDAARIRFREFMAKREAPAAAAFPGKVFAVSNIPIRVPEHFLGRDDALAAIDTALARYNGRVAITALHGLRGVGKTTLAAAYAERHRSDYRATWWIRAQTPDGMRADLVALGVRLNWVAPDEKEEPAFKIVMERLVHEGEGILLIHDNAVDADGIKPYLPRGGAARVLVTSNAHAWRGVAAPVEIRLWPKETGADYLIARTGRTAEHAAALALSEALGGLPLAHEQAAAYCERLDLPLAEYAKRFIATPAKFLDDARHAPAEYHDGLTVAKTFGLAIDEAAKLHPAAEPLIVHAALLAPEPIPLFLFSRGREKLGEPLASMLEGDGLDEAVATLRTFALIDRETVADERDPAITTESIRLHRLVRRVAAARCEGEARENAQRALVEALVAVYPENIWRDPHAWRLSRRLDPLTLALVGDDVSAPKGVEQRTAELLVFAGQYRQHALAAFAEARPLHERALAIREKVLGAEHPDTASSLNNLADPLLAQGDLAGARRLCERALAIDEKVLGAEHPTVATSLNNLGYLLKAQGDLAGARPLYERALAIREKVLGAEHPRTTTSLNNLANLLRAQGDLAGARPLFERALAIREKALGAEHPETATSLNNLGRLLQDLGQLDNTEPLFLRAIAVGDKALGAEHPLTCRYRSNYARLLLITDRPAEALQLAQASLAVHERVNGPNHPWTKDSAGVTADALAALGRAAEAKALRKKYGIEDQAV